MGIYAGVFNRVVTRIDAERAHVAALRALSAAGRAPGAAKLSRRAAGSVPELAVEALGLTFPNPLGLAAGLDKNAVALNTWAGFGFGFVEIGTVTGEGQPGNPRPRLFRLPRDGAIVNRMGFNNDGAAEVAARLAAWRQSYTGPPVVLGVNIGKTKAVLDDEAIADYEASARLLSPYADYLVVNVSSPNTPGLRDLQATERLRPLLAAVASAAAEVRETPVPLLVKIAPDLADTDVRAVADLAREVGLDGIVATNTTISRDGLATDRAEVESIGAGGLSGRPLAERSFEVLAMLRKHLGPDFPLISVGGVWTPEDVSARLDAGATLVQAYSAFIYQGASWPRRVLAHLRASVAA